MALEGGDPSELDELTRQLRAEVGMFFAFQGETWKYQRTITLAGFLILICPIYFGIDETIRTHAVSIITAGFALLSGIFFFFRK